MKAIANILSIGTFILVTVASTPAQTTFTDVTSTTGIAVPDNRATLTFGNPDWVDFDGDGYLDVFVGNHYSDPPNLFRNNHNGTFTDIQVGSGIRFEGDPHGGSWGDFNGDGLLDLFRTVGGDSGNVPPNKTDRLYQNNGNGTFTDVTAHAGVQNSKGRGRSVNWVDFNNDGLLDLYLQNLTAPNIPTTSNILYRNNGDGTFTDVTTVAGLANIPGEISSWADYNNDGCMDLMVVGQKSSDQLWKNNCDGTFTNVTAAAGISSKTSGLGIAWGDYNNDGNIDLYVSRGDFDLRTFDWNSSNIRFSDKQRNGQGGIDFTTTASQVKFRTFVNNCPSSSQTFYGALNKTPLSEPFTLTARQAAGMPTYMVGQSTGIFIWDDSSGWHIRETATTGTFFYGFVNSNGTFQTVTGSNLATVPKLSSTLYRNNGNGTFTDVTAASGLGASLSNNTGAAWGDYDNDGYLDLFVVNSGSIRGNGVNHLYHNKGNGTFTDVASSAGLANRVNGRGDGAAWGDFNKDGFLDLYVVNGEIPRIPIIGASLSSCLAAGPHVLYRNNGNTNNWLNLNLRGVVSNRFGMGARITLQAGSLKQFREVNGGGGERYSQGGPMPIHFGLRSARSADSVTIHWPSGITQTLKNVSADRTVTITERSTTRQRF